ncbi:sigma factor [Kitasatospora sp. McL0602]|uniref:sigma factor n=1 Tax=Kitasatospora sp. McL0602 TaxID=3439530 RepID=UPI003F8AAAD7
MSVACNNAEMIVAAKAGDPTAKHAVLDSIGGMIHDIAAQQLAATPMGNTLEDLKQDASVAALQALDSFSPGKAKFSTFAYKVITGEVLSSAFRNGTSGVNEKHVKTYRSALGKTDGDHEAAAAIVTDSAQVGKMAMSDAAVQDVRAALAPTTTWDEVGEELHPLSWAETEDFDLAPELRDESDAERAHRTARVELAHAVLATLPAGFIAALELVYGLNEQPRLVHMDPESPQFGQPDAHALADHLGVSHLAAQKVQQRAHARLAEAGKSAEFTTLPLEIADLYRADQLRPEPRSNRPVEKRPAGRHSGPTAKRYSGGFACSGRAFEVRDTYFRA